MSLHRSGRGLALICTDPALPIILRVNLPEPSENAQAAKAPKAALAMMIAILAGMALVAIYSNVQRWRRDKIETVIVTPFATPAATATP